MSVRRLSPNQPASFAFSPATLKAAKAWMANFPAGRQQSAVVPVLWLVQKQEGWVSEPAIRAGSARVRLPSPPDLERVTARIPRPDPAL